MSFPLALGCSPAPGWDAPAYLDDLVVALRRVPHDYVLEGWLAARSLGGEWLPREGLAGVLRADVVANPVLMPRDLLALDERARVAARGAIRELTA